MSGKFCDEGEARVLDILLGAQVVDGLLYLGLYKNTSEPAEVSTLADMQEPSGFGYARVTLTRGDWAFTDDYATYAQQVFLASGGAWGDIYGYFIGTTADDSGKLMALEHFASYYDIQDDTGIRVTPKIVMS
jgi:hypothetical protein